MHKVVPGLFLVACLLCLGACGHLPNIPDDKYQAALRSQGRDLGNEGAVLYEAYLITVDKYVTPLEPETAFDSALTGFAEFVGKEHLSYSKDGGRFLISSSGETIAVDRILDRTQGARELARTYFFVAAMNTRANPRNLAYAGVAGMVKHDDYSRLVPPVDPRRTAAIGLVINKKQGAIHVTEVIDDSPAMKAGLLPDDRITTIDGRPTKDLTIPETVNLLRGEESAVVALTVERDGSSKPVAFSIRREKVTAKNVRYRLLDSRYVYVRITYFAEGTAVLLDQAMKELISQSKEGIRGIVLDLRSNPGGSLDESIEVARRFVQTGLIASIEGRTSSRNMKFYGGKRTFYPYSVVVLVNQESGSGSALLAGALQDHKRAVVVGTPTFSNNSIQTVYLLKDGSALKLTTSIWRLPRNVSTEETGIAPDILVDADARGIKDLDRDAAVNAALEILKKGNK